MKNIAVSIDTLGGAADAAIVSVSALAFDPHSPATSEIFHRAVDIDSCLILGLSVDGTGIRHWAEIINPSDQRTPVPVQLALVELSRSFDWQDSIVWMDLANNTNAVLDTAYRKNFQRAPWAFYNLRDVATHLDGHQLYGRGDSREAVRAIAHQIQAANGEFRVKQA